MGYLIDVISLKINREILFQRRCNACKEKYFIDISETEFDKCFVCEKCDPFIPDNAIKILGNYGAFKVVDMKNIIYNEKINRASTKNYKKILKRDEFICQYCYRDGNTVDHILPITAGGNNNMENLVCACNICNSVASNLLFATLSHKRNYIWERRFKK